jgi:hypothetical protein
MQEYTDVIAIQEWNNSAAGNMADATIFRKE